MHPTHLGPYEIRSRLGRGGMGAVYEAVDTFTGDTVAVKVLASHLADDPGLRARFESEIEALKSLRHPGIVRLLAFGSQDDQPFFAMELVRGRSLEQVLRAGRRFPWRDTVSLALEITGALKAAHDHGIVHRDMKPANLLLLDAPTPVDRPAGATGDASVRAVTVKLADFGIARIFGSVGHTAMGSVVGTAEYMAPEQASGRPIDHRADLYCLGLVMFAMLAGGPPFRGTQLLDVIDKQRRVIPPRVSTLVADVPPELDELIARLLAKDPAQRPASALALARLLAAIEVLHAPTPSSVAGSVGPHRDAAAPTAHERSNRPTRSDTVTRAIPDAAGTPSAQPTGPGSAFDPLAATQPVIPAIGRTAAQPSRRPAVAPPAAPRGDASPPRPTRGSTAETRDFADRSIDRGNTGAAAAEPPSRLPTDVATAATQVDHGERNRFVTVAQSEREAAAKARREWLWQTSWQAATFATVAIGMVWAVSSLLRQPTADTLHGRIMAIADAPDGDLRDARTAMETFLERHGDDPRADRVRELKRTLDLDILERRARRRSRGDRELQPLERDYRAAMANEQDGPSACVRALDAMLAVHASAAPPADTPESLWLDLARRKVEQLRPQAAAEQRDDATRIDELLAEAASLAARAEIANDAAARRQFTTQRRAVLGSIVEVYARRPHAAEAVAFATRELAASATVPAAASPAGPTIDPFLDPAAPPAAR